MIGPDAFGCSAKLSFQETVRLAGATGEVAGDFSRVPGAGDLVTSIDRVHRCAADWARFARIALNHAFGDVVCAGAVPVQALLAFEFGIDASEEDRATCSEAFVRELSVRGVSLGKCHSAQGAGVTAVTVAVTARPLTVRPELREGTIRISRPVGAFKLHYLHEMGVEVDAPEAIQLLEHPDDDEFHRAPWSLVTDVSGHGLLGAMTQVGRGHGLAIWLDLSSRHAVSPEVLTVPVECLQNAPSSYGVDLSDLSPEALILATLRETAGPFLGFLEDDLGARLPGGGPGVRIGRYSRAGGRVDVSWSA